MKKSRVLLLISALLVLATVLSSCGNVVSRVGKFLNEDYDPVVDVYTKANNIAELEGYSINDSASNETFVVLYLTETAEGTVKTSYKLLSLYSGTVVATVVDDPDTRYEFLQHDVEAAPSIIVKKTALNASEINLTPDVANTVLVELAKAALAFRNGDGLTEQEMNLLDDYLTVTYSLYDPTGAVVATTKYLPTWPASFADYAVYDDVAYSVNEETGAWTKEMEIPEYVALNGYLTYNDDYYYTANNGVLTVYDHEFKVVSTYVAPNYGDESIVSVAELLGGMAGDGFKVLNNGNILYQYGVIQDEDEKKYDISYVSDGVTCKVNLISLLINAKKGEAKELDLDYVVATVRANNILFDEELAAEENVYNQDFENIAVIAPIEDGKILGTVAQMDVVLMNNKAKAGKSLKMVEGQSWILPEKIDEDLYTVQMLNGNTVLINGKGEIQNTLNNAMRVVGSYFVGEDAIYSLSLEKIQDLKDPDVSYTVLGESIFVTKKTDSKTFTVDLLLNGETKTVYSQNKDSKTALVWGDGYYYVINEAGDYVYYNEKGEQLVTTKRALTATTYASGTNHTLLLVGNPVDSLVEKAVYYVLTK